MPTENEIFIDRLVQTIETSDVHFDIDTEHLRETVAAALILLPEISVRTHAESAMTGVVADVTGESVDPGRLRDIQNILQMVTGGPAHEIIQDSPVDEYSLRDSSVVNRQVGSDPIRLMLRQIHRALGDYLEATN